ncbi:hypothetical protein D3C86_1865960 [compost metagenome]
MSYLPGRRFCIRSGMLLWSMIEPSCESAASARLVPAKGPLPTVAPTLPAALAASSIGATPIAEAVFWRPRLLNRMLQSTLP